MNRKTEEVYWLTEALRINPNLTHALINLGGVLFLFTLINLT